uniref:Uncharacterized protein n=1 Tax=Meloidogyne enterolobii TaxID=390850 RepID=A0A6V7VBZ1_MELEN|nr:unnamed protein product [Meloidogyne enterolobii]
MNITQCTAAEEVVLDTKYNIIRILTTILSIIVIVLLLQIIWFYKTKTVKLHTNLIILIGNVFFLYAIYVLSFMLEAVVNFVVLFTYSNPCDCLTPVWLVYLIRIPAFFYCFGSPLFHLAITIERVLATVYVKIYENQGKFFGVISTIIVFQLNDKLQSKQKLSIQTKYPFNENNFPS